MTTHPPPVSRRERGIALAIVMLVIAITLVMSSDFGTETTTDLLAAANYRDQMRAHFLARSALNFGQIIIHIQSQLDSTSNSKTVNLTQITDYADQLMAPFCGSAGEVKDTIGFTTNEIKGLTADVGTCGFNGPITTDDDKLNLNCANTSSQGVIQAALFALIYPIAYDGLFNDNDAEGWHRDRETQVAAFIDYIDTNTMHLSQRGTTEDYGYENLKDRYYPKDSAVGHHTGNYVDTIGELKLVRGVDDRFWTLFGAAMTVYGGCKINMSYATNPQLIAAVLYLSAQNQNDPVVLDPKRLFLLAGYVAKAREFGETFGSNGDFINFVKDPSSAVQMIASQDQGTLSGSAASAALSQGLPGLSGGEKIGLVLDPNHFSQIAQVTQVRRTYRVQAYGEIERAQKNKDNSAVFPSIRSTYNGVWDTKVVPQNVRKPPVPNGAWVFLRED